MSSIVFSRYNLANLIEHHIALLERFGLTQESPFALIFFNLESKSEQENIALFQQILRKTDAIFTHENHYVVMLPGTDWNGATEVLSGIQDFLGQEAFDNVVTYPEDGSDAYALIKSLNNKVEDNCGISSDLLITQGL